MNEDRAIINITSFYIQPPHSEKWGLCGGKVPTKQKRLSTKKLKTSAVKWLGDKDSNLN